MSHAGQVQSQNSDPQNFQLVIHIFYNPGSSRADGLSTSDTSWHQQCRRDLSAMKLPLPPTNSLVCNKSECKIQMAWNVHATDHIVKIFSRAFDLSTPSAKEIQQKLDFLDIYQMYMLKRWMKPSGGGSSLSFFGFVRSSKALSEHEAALKHGLRAPWGSPALLAPTLPFSQAPHSRKSSLSAGPSSLIIPKPTSSNFSPSSPSPPYAPVSPPLPSSPLLPISSPLPSSPLLPISPQIHIPPSLPFKPTSSALPQRAHGNANKTVPPKGAPTRSIPSTLPDKLASGNVYRGREGGSNVDIPLGPRKRSLNMISSDSIPTNSAIPVKRARIDSENPPQSVGGGVGHGMKADDLERKCADLEAQLARERKARGVAETRLLRLRREYGNGKTHDTTAATATESQIAEIREQLLFAQGDVEIHKSKARNLEQELAPKQAQLEAEEALVNQLRQQVDRERRDADLVRYETERLKVQNTSLLHDVHKLEQAREGMRVEMKEMVEARDKEIEKLGLQVERREQQLAEYAEKLRLVVEEGGEKRAMVRELDDKGGSEELEPERIVRGNRSEEWDRLRVELDRERILRVELEGVVEDLRRECRTPFLVPALVDAFAEISKLTTRTRITLEDEKDVDEVNYHLRTASPS